MKNLKHKNKQTGAALAIGMMLLLIISVIGITSMKSALLQEKMAGGLKSRELSDAAALTLLAAGESFLQNYYKSSNGTLLSVGIAPVVEPRTDMVRSFRTERNMDEGFTHPLGESLISRFNGELAEEPRMLIEDIESAAASFAGSTGGGAPLMTDTSGEAGEGSSASNSGSSSDSGYNEGLIRKYRVIAKATDSTGYIYTGFESVVSVKTR